MGYHLWGHKELGMTEPAPLHYTWIWELSEMSNFKGWLESGIYAPNLVGEKKGGKRVLMERQMIFWQDKWALENE